jgi:hypothetical protein
MSDLIINAFLGGTLTYPGLPDNCCFFFKRELGRTKRELKSLLAYNHVKISRNKQSGNLEFLDYSGRKMYFTSLEEWVRFEGLNLNDVLYGRQEFDGKNNHITLDELLRHLRSENDDEMESKEEDPSIEEITGRIQNVTLTNCTVFWFN